MIWTFFLARNSRGHINTVKSASVHRIAPVESHLALIGHWTHRDRRGPARFFLFSIPCRGPQLVICARWGGLSLFPVPETASAPHPDSYSRQNHAHNYA